MRQSRFGRLAERVTDNRLARRVLASVIDHALDSMVCRFREKLDGILPILDEPSLLTGEGRENSRSEAILLELGESHRNAGVQMLEVIRGTASYRDMVRSVIDGLESCKESEVESFIAERISDLEDPLARAFIRAALFERDHILNVLRYLKENGIDDLDGKDLVQHAPAIMDALRFSQSDLIRDVIESEPGGVVARALKALLALKHAGEEK